MTALIFMFYAIKDKGKVNKKLFNYKILTIQMFSYLQVIHLSAFFSRH